MLTMGSDKKLLMLKSFVPHNVFSVLYKMLEAMPLLVFLTFVSLTEPETPLDWTLPYVASSLTAVVVVFTLIFHRILFNPIFIGINCYLITGAIGLVFNYTWLNQLYGYLQASGMLAWVVIVGFVFLIYNP